MGKPAVWIWPEELAKASICTHMRARDDGYLEQCLDALVKAL